MSIQIPKGYTPAELQRINNVCFNATIESNMSTNNGTTALNKLTEAQKGDNAAEGISYEEYKEIEIFAKKQTQDNKSKLYLSGAGKTQKQAIADGREVSDLLNCYISHPNNEKNLKLDIVEAKNGIENVQAQKPKFWQRFTLGSEEYNKRLKNYNKNYAAAQSNLGEAERNVISPKTIVQVNNEKAKKIEEILNNDIPPSIFLR